jgi:hypothetical protein
MTRRICFLIAASLCTLLTSITIVQAQTRQDSVARIYLPGFSILPPTGMNWSQHSEPEKGIFLFGKLKYADQGREKVHSFVLLARWMSLEFPPEAYLNDQQLVDRLRESLRAEVRPEWLKSLEASIDIEKETIIEAPKDQDTSRPIQRMTIKHRCIRYRMQQLDEDRFSKPPQPVLTIESRGKRCLHPLYPQYVIGISYSQRSRGGDWDASFDSEADRFLQSPEIEPVPLSPYVSKKLVEYASMLNKLERQTEASKIKQYADKLEKPFQTSTYPGFDPGKVLLEYADLLRTQNDELEAKQMQILAKMWQWNNMAGYLRALQKAPVQH